MRRALRADEAARLAALVDREGTLAAAVRVGCTTNTIRAALRGARLQGPTVRAIQIALAGS